MTAGFGLVPLSAVAAGCAIGAVVRFEISRRFVQRFGDGFPWATLLINLSGCLLAGVALVISDSTQASNSGLFLIFGVLGGYTTVSSFSLEALLLFRRGHSARARVYVAASLFGCPLAALVGAALSAWIATPWSAG